MNELSTSFGILLGVVQGLTEFLPISSSGHLILVREVFGTVSSLDLSFDALLHFATAAAILVYFRVDILNLIRAFFRLMSGLGKRSLDTDELLVVALMVGTIPAVIFGLLLESMLETAFRNPLLIAGTLVLGSLVMLGAESIHKKQVLHNDSLVRNEVGWKSGLILGLFQSLALVPGMSRSGMTISGGMMLGLSRQFAAKFGFLLGVPILLGAGAKKMIDIGISEITAPLLWGSATAFVVALLVIHFLLRFLRNNTLRVFILYRLLLAMTIVLVVLL